MTDARPVEYYDPIPLSEVATMADLMIAANNTDHRMSQHAIDVALGLRHALQLS